MFRRRAFTSLLKLVSGRGPAAKVTHLQIDVKTATAKGVIEAAPTAARKDRPAPTYGIVEWQLPRRPPTHRRSAVKMTCALVLKLVPALPGLMAAGSALSPTV